MINNIINGKLIAERLLKKLSVFVSELKLNHNIIPSLNVIIVGDDPASHLYVRNKENKAKYLGLNSETIFLPKNTSENKLLDTIKSMNENKSVNGILVQLPLPKHLDKNVVINQINSQKDVDGFHNENVGKLVTGQEDCLIPCTPQGCIYLIKTVQPNIAGSNAVVIGRSNIVGKPMFHLLLKENCTTTILHSASNNIAEHCLRSDIVVSAVGKPNFVQASWIKPGAIVIDVGINLVTEHSQNKFVGDIDFIEAQKIASAITPVPGGVGPMTIAFLMVNTIIATYKQNNIKFNYSGLLNFH